MPVSTANKDKLKKELQRNDEIEITVVGRKSGRPITNTVWFVSEDDTLYLVPVQGSQTQWFKNAVKRPTLKISAGGAEGEFAATIVTDPKVVSEVADKFREKYGAADVKKYYSSFEAAVRIYLAEV